MNIAEASYRVGQAIRRIDQGKQLVDLFNKAKDITSQDAWSNFYKLLISGGRQGIKHYYSIPNTYYLLEANKENEELLEPLKDEITEILSIEEYKQLCDLGIYFGNAIEELLKDMFKPLIPKNFAGTVAKPKLKRSIQDLYVAFQRTEIVKYLLREYEKRQDFIDLISTYDSKRKDYPFSKENRIQIKEIANNVEQTSLLFLNEAINSIFSFMKQIIFESHMGLITELSHDDVRLKRVKSVNKLDIFKIDTHNPYILNQGNILKITSPTNTEYGLIYERRISFTQYNGMNCRLTGYLYPTDDQGLFTKK
jgi:hypothetical protein